MRYDLLTGNLRLELQDGFTIRPPCSFQHTPLPVGALRLSDLGYFDLAVLAETQRQQAYWLTRPQARAPGL